MSLPDPSCLTCGQRRGFGPDEYTCCGWWYRKQKLQPPPEPDELKDDEPKDKQGKLFQ